jgi:hypothetical protein
MSKKEVDDAELQNERLKLLYRIAELVQHRASSQKRKHTRVIANSKTIRQDQPSTSCGRDRKKGSRQTGELLVIENRKK